MSRMSHCCNCLCSISRKVRSHTVCWAILFSTKSPKPRPLKVVQELHLTKKKYLKQSPMDGREWWLGVFELKKKMGTQRKRQRGLAEGCGSRGCWHGHKVGLPIPLISLHGLGPDFAPTLEQTFLIFQEGLPHCVFKPDVNMEANKKKGTIQCLEGEAWACMSALQSQRITRSAPLSLPFGFFYFS